MKLPSEKHQKFLPAIRKNVESANKYFQYNYERYSEFRKFVFKSTMSADDITLLQTLKKPQVEFNIMEAFISRLRGEFAKYEPSITVGAQDGQEIEPEVLDFYEGHIRYILTEANNNGCEYNIYSDSLTGGFSGFKVWTEYLHDLSFEQVIKLGRVSDPCLMGFDPLAQLPHKADGQYAFELFPMTKKEFHSLYPEVDIERLDFSRSLGPFNWSYSTGQEKILLVCDYYEKKKNKVKIVRLSTGETKTIDEYKKFEEEWLALGRIEPMPTIVDERYSDMESIVRYRLIENKILEYVKTDFKAFPIVFVDGNSVLLRDSSGTVEQMTRPYVYHAKGVQKLKNFAGQTWANEMENMVQHKFMIAKEAIPLGYEDAYTDVQVPNVVVYNAFNNNNPDQPVPPPREIQRTQMPPEVIAAFQTSEQTMQSILGSYDPQIGNLNESGLSGIAIIESASLGNAAAMPYIVGFLQGLNQVAQIIADLIPKYYATPRSIPIIDKEGKHQFVKINQEGGINLNHEKNAIAVKVQAGTAFAIQKSRALQQITALMQSSQLFAQFMNTDGLSILLDNIEIRGIDQLKVLAGEWMEKMKQQEQAAMEAKQQQSNQPDPMMMQMQLAQKQLELEQQKIQLEAEIEQAKLELEEQDLLLKNKKIDVEADIKAQQATTDRLKALSEIESAAIKADMDLRKTDTDEFHRAIDVAMKTEDKLNKEAQKEIRNV